MNSWRLWLSLGVAALLFGCAGSPIKPVELGLLAGPGDAAPLYRTLEAYNAPPGTVKVAGSLRLEGMGTADYGARVEPGLGVRLDVVTGVFAKLVLSSACREGQGCEFYLPELNALYRERDPRAADWLASLVSGRVPLVSGSGSGRTTAWEDSQGRAALRIEGESGSWQLIVFNADATLPAVVHYGRRGRPASLEITYGEFFQEGGRWFPGTVTLLGEDSTEGARFEAARVVVEQTPSGRSFALRIPAGVEIVDNAARIWRQLGLSWTPWASEAGD
jgi:hypothetical protein